MELRVRYFILIAFITLSGCGYHVMGVGAGDGGTSAATFGALDAISIPFFENRSSKPAVESVITKAFAEEFMKSVDLRADAPVVLRGTVVSYKLTPIAFTENDVVSKYRVTVSLSVRVEKEGSVVWSESIKDYEDFTVSTVSVVRTKDAEARAVEKIASDVARTIKERVMGVF